MPKPRSSKSTLFQLLNEAQAPIYILNHRSQLVFANQALCNWLKLEFSKIELQPCQAGTEITLAEPANTLRGLAIPNAAFRTPHSTGTVFRTAADKHLIWRKANFTRLSGSSDLAGSVLVTLYEADSPTPNPSDPSGEWTRQWIAKIRDRKIQDMGLDLFIGTSPQAQKLNAQIRLASVAPESTNLLLSGPSGSELQPLATAIHQARFTSPPQLTPIDCDVADAQTIQQSILQSRQAGTDGAGDWFRLDYPESLSPDAVNELLGFLQLPQHSLHLVSVSNRPAHIAPRLLAYLDTLSVQVPPLSERKTDIPLLADFLLKEETDNPQIEFDEEAKQHLVDYNWPNNLLELKSTIHQVTINADAELATKEDFPDRFRHALLAQQIGQCETPEIQLEDYLASIEAELIGRALQHTKNNKAQACKLLGISRAKLGRRIQQLGLAGEEVEPIIFEESPEDE